MAVATRESNLSSNPDSMSGDRRQRTVQMLTWRGVQTKGNGGTNQFKEGPYQRKSLSSVETSNNSLDEAESSHREQNIWRLLEESDSRYDFLLWLELVHTRRRIHGPEGIRLVWRVILERGVDLPNFGDTADGLWSQLLELGFRDPDVLKEIFVYAREQKELRGRAWPKLYVTVVGRYLKANPDRASICHMRLHKHFPPSNQQLRQLLRLALPNEKLRHLFLSIHKYFPEANVYDIAIPELCKQGLYATAVTWHKKLIERKDLPSSARATEPVMRHLAATGDKTRLIEYTRLLVAAGVSFKPFIPSMISSEMLDVVQGQKDDFPQKEYSDTFCARLMATRFFSIDNIMSALRLLGIREIGPLTLRELATRELPYSPYCRAVQNRLDGLSKAGISTGRSTFSVLVCQLAAEGQSHLLANIISCDLHTDTFEDYNLQESLLSYYHKNGDTLAFNRTMAILTAKVSEQSVPTRRWNFILRSYLTRQELQAVKNTIEKMQDLQIQVEPKSITHMRHTMLSRRQVGRGPADTKGLDLLIRIWQDVLRSGAFFPPRVWTEVLRRLGMSGRLIAFERLALWLAAWYASPAYRTSLFSILSQRNRNSEHLYVRQPESQMVNFQLPNMNINLKPRNRLHPLQDIFAPSLQQAIVAWGFQRAHSVRQGRGRHRGDWTWGLVLLRKLRNRNVQIGQPNVSKAFKLRLIGLFGSRYSRRKINRMNRQRNRESLEQYIEKGKEIWGPDLFKRRQTDRK
ncbi:MAG: hypothetical protein Q9166_000999 [cf. Caloplaca sp. 2 TL-2023]